MWQVKLDPLQQERVTKDPDHSFSLSNTRTRRQKLGKKKNRTEKSEEKSFGKSFYLAFESKRNQSSRTQTNANART